VTPIPDHDRLTSLEVRMSSAEVEIVRTRERLHELENDRASVRALAETVRNLVDGIPQMSKRIAQETVSQWWEQRITAMRETWKFRLAWVSAGGVLVGTFGYLLDHVV